MVFLIQKNTFRSVFNSDKKTCYQTKNERICLLFKKNAVNIVSIF